ncbi:hypothetical protein WJT74_06350 [Sphingomicrobium sp. XHP0239]|uniref:hypothetical protein n=1 Tax=Sphingomicrobium maritimum TaxID=3133972 RepID=UPI0031CC6FE0
MTTNRTDPVLTELLEQLDGMSAALNADLVSTEAPLTELRRLANVAPHRRGGPHSMDANKYRLGSALVLMGLEDLDVRFLTGLLARPRLMVKWMGEALLQHPDARIVSLLQTIQNSDVRSDYCRRTGAAIAWRWRKRLYDAAVRSFLESGRCGEDEPWRKRTVTVDQDYLIDEICELLDLPRRVFCNRGEAFDWIRAIGGNPNYWTAPDFPSEQA